MCNVPDSDESVSAADSDVARRQPSNASAQSRWWPGLEDRGLYLVCMMLINNEANFIFLFFLFFLFFFLLAY